MAKVLGIKGKVAGLKGKVQNAECSECCGGEDRPSDVCCAWLRDLCDSWTDYDIGRRGRLSISHSTTYDFDSSDDPFFPQTHHERTSFSLNAIQTNNCGASLTSGTLHAEVAHTAPLGGDYTGLAIVPFITGEGGLLVPAGNGVYEIDSDDPDGPQGVGNLFRTGDVYLAGISEYLLATDGQYGDRVSMFGTWTVYHNIMACMDGEYSYDDSRGVFTGTISREDYSNVTMSFDYREPSHAEGMIHIFGSYHAVVTFEECEPEGLTLPSRNIVVPHSAEIEAYMARDPMRSCRGCGN